MIEMRKVEPVHDLDALVEMAHDIWFEYWPTRIGVDQTAYMVEQFQSKDAIARDIAEHGYEYYFVIDKAGKTVGYVGVAPERFSGDTENPRAKEHGEAITPLHADRLFISKVYLYAEERGKHYSSQILAWLRDYARKLELTGMYLTVNKGNDLGIRAYKGNGFDIIESVEADIGNGFMMDDYIMACAV